MKRKKVSIIVPVWNVEDYIGMCLDSLIKQTLDDIEIIVVNDGSPDNSQKIIDEYVKKYPNIIKSFTKENGGQGTARNLGLQKANGEYVSFIDSDDYIDRNFAKEMYECAVKNKADVVVCDMVDKYPDKTIYHDVTNFKYLYQTTPSVCNKIFKKELFDDVKFLGKYWYEDLHIMYKIYHKINKVSVIHKGYYTCNCREISTMTNNNSEKNLDMLYILDDAKKYLQSINQFDENIYNYLVFDHVLITTVNRVSIQDNKNKNKVIKELINYCHKNIKNYKKYEFYKEIARNRKIIAFLNYHSLYRVSKFVLSLKNH